ncbi:MAG: DUF503 domain-containing protein [Thermosulfidibacteraceae bacterium]|jgi:uncharacterized protein YlxP (DUF503 family)
MIVGTLQIVIEIPCNNTLKGKRRVLKGLMERIRGRFNVSVSEVGNQDAHQIATIGIACVGTDKGVVDSMLQEVISFVEMHPEVVMLDYYLELL